MEKCVICERTAEEIKVGEHDPTDDRKFVFYDYGKGGVNICVACRLLLGQQWLIHPKMKKRKW